VLPKLLFSIKTEKSTARVEGQTHEGALAKHLTERRCALLRLKDSAQVDELFSQLPRKAVVTRGGSSKFYKVKWEEIGKLKFPGSCYVFSVKESGLGRFIGALRRGLNSR
jgi:hypothetical protein